jgi:catechol 2,3-dioxygenase-like lactoylglutathione lyase family enzyme
MSGVIVVSRQPGRVTEFYRDVLGLPLVEERHGETQLHWACELGDVHFAIHPAEDYPDDPAGGPGPVKLAFMVFDLSGMVAWLDHCGIPLCYPPADLGEESQITAVRDPDGNLVELTQLGPGWLGHVKGQPPRGERSRIRLGCPPRPVSRNGSAAVRARRLRIAKLACRWWASVARRRGSRSSIAARCG